MTTIAPAYVSESVTLFLGDCLEIAPGLEGVDAVVMDPPYGVEFCSGWDNAFQGVKIHGDQDTSSRDSILEWSANRPCLCFGTWKAPRPIHTKAVLIWDKGTVGMGDLTIPWFPSTEEIYVLGEGFTGTRTSATMYEHFRNKFHPTEKPIGLMIRLVEKVIGTTICDPFMGSGTTGIACLRTGRKFIGIEKDPAHFATALERIKREEAQGRLL